MTEGGYHRLLGAMDDEGAEGYALGVMEQLREGDVDVAEAQVEATLLVGMMLAAVVDSLDGKRQ